MGYHGESIELRITQFQANLHSLSVRFFICGLDKIIGIVAFIFQMEIITILMWL